MIPFELARLLARSFPITSKLIYKQNNDSKIFLMMLKRLLDAKTTQKTHKSECVTDRPTDRPTDHTVEYRVAFTRLKMICCVKESAYLGGKMTSSFLNFKSAPGA